MVGTRIGLKRGVALFALAAIVVPLSALGFLFISYHERTTIAEITAENAGLAASVRSNVNNFLSAPLRTLGAVANLAVDPAFSPHIDALLSRMVESYGFFESIMVLDRDGVVRHLGSARENGVDRDAYLGFDISESEHVARARVLKKHTWSDTYISLLTGRPTLSLTMPFQRGMVIGNFNLDYLRSIVMPPLPHAHDRVYLVNGKGRIIAHPDRAKVLQQVNVSNLPVVRAGLEGREGVYEYDDDGISYISAVQIVPETGWMVIVERNRNEVFASLRVMQRVLVLAVVSALSFMALLMAYLNSRLVKPVVAISTATKHIAGGSFQPLPDYQGRIAELDDVTRNFNTMTTALRDRERDLEDRNRDLEREAENLIRSEEALRRSEERFQEIFDSVNDTIIIQDAGTGAILDVNRRMIDMFGYSREEADRMTMDELSSGEPPYSQGDAIAWIKRASSGKPQLFEWRFRHKDGRLFWGEVNMRMAAIGGRKCMLVAVRDITQRKLVEEKLHESERLYRMLFDSAGDAIFLMQESRIVDCNNKTLDMFGCSWEQLLGSTPIRFSPPIQPDGRDSQEKILEKITAALAGEPQNYEWKYVRADGTSFDAEVSLGRIELSFGVRLQAIVRDITGRKQAEESLRDLVAKVSRSQKEWQDTFDSITDMISIHDKDFNVIRANKAFSGFLGLSPREVINKKCFHLMHHGALSPIAGCPHQRTLREKMPVTEEVFDEKTRKTFRIATYPYYSPAGEIIGSIHIARDITGEKEREMGLIMTERLASLGQMASGIAHEINNPLESVMICAEMLLMKVAQDKFDHAQFEKYLKIIDEEVLRCRDITSSMLTFSRQTAADKQDIDIHLLLDKAIDLVGYQGRLRNVQVIKRYGEQLRVRGNEGELRQVFLVLVINALDAMVNKGTLTVETGAQESGIWVRISDTGPGIPPENIQKIFQPFYTTKIDTGGTGLGLSIAHRIIANHQGTIGISSEPGQGAAFTITLPV
jgi:PAS domain S-box-containing protein